MLRHPKVIGHYSDESLLMRGVVANSRERVDKRFRFRLRFQWRANGTLSAGADEFGTLPGDEELDGKRRIVRGSDLQRHQAFWIKKLERLRARHDEEPNHIQRRILNCHRHQQGHPALNVLELQRS